MTDAREATDAQPGPDAVQRVFSITRLEERLEMVDDAGSIG